MQVAERRAHHVLQVESLGARIVFLELDLRAVDLERRERAVGEMMVSARAVVLFDEAGERDRFVGLAGVGEHEARRACARAEERDTASPHRGRIAQQIDPGGAIDHSRTSIGCAGTAELIDQRGERRLIVGDAVPG